jgi:hypothetical protein
MQYNVIITTAYDTLLSLYCHFLLVFVLIYFYLEPLKGHDKRSSKRQQSMLRQLQLRRQLRESCQMVAKYKSLSKIKPKNLHQVSSVDKIVHAASKYLSGPA